MKRNNLFDFTGFLLVFALVTLGIGCSSDSGNASDDYEPMGDPLDTYTDDELLEKGKESLENFSYAAAEEFFNKRIERLPDDPQATYGLVLADMQHWVALLNLILGLIFDEDPTQYADPVIPQKSYVKKHLYKVSLKILQAEDNPDSNVPYPLADLLGTLVIDDLRALQEEQLARLAKLKQMPDVTFTLNRFPVSFHRVDLFELGREWDLADVYMVDALTQSLYALVAILDSQNLTDARLVEIYPDLMDNLSLENIPILIARVLERYPSFLSLDEGGSESFQAAFDALRTAAEDIKKAGELVAAEIDDQSDDVLTLGESEDVDGENVVRSMYLNGAFFKEDGGSVKTFEMLWQGEKYGPMHSADQILANLEGETGRRLRLEHDVLGMLAILADLLRQTITIQGLLDELGLDIDPELIALIDDGTFNGPEDMPVLLVSALELALFSPSLLELDLGAFLQRPVGLLQVLPNQTPGTLYTDPRFLAAYECARLGFTDATLDDAAGKEAPSVDLVLDDPFTTETTREIIAVSLKSTGEDSFDEVDHETFTTNEIPEGTGRFTASIPLDYDKEASTTTDAVSEDGVLSLAGSEILVVTYLEDGVDGESFEITARYEEDGTDRKWSEGLSCLKDTSRDREMFSESSEILQSLPDDGEAVLSDAFSPVYEDGFASPSAYYAWRSGSLNNLLWVNLSKIAPSGYTPSDHDLPEGMAKTDATTLNLFLRFFMDQF